MDKKWEITRIEFIIRMTLLALLVYICFQILGPFITSILWGIMITVALIPTHNWLAEKLGGRTKLSAVLITILLVLIILIPAYLLGDSIARGIQYIQIHNQAGELIVPKPDPAVRDWPFIGTQVYDYWDEAHNDPLLTLGHFEKQIRGGLTWLVNALKNLGIGIVEFFVAALLAGFLLYRHKEFLLFSGKLMHKLLGDRAEVIERGIGMTIRSVAIGIIGVAIIQSLMAGASFIAVGIPLAGIWTIVCLLLASMQIGLFPVVLPVLIYTWATMDTTTAILMTIWLLFVGFIDNILRAIIFGKTAPVPMVVVFIGSFGGFITMGLLGLFTGAVLMALGYKILMYWIDPAEAKLEDLKIREAE